MVLVYVIQWDSRKGSGFGLHILFRCHDPPNDRFLVVGSPTCGAQAVHVLLDIVEAELTDLVAAWTWSKATIRQIELLDAERAVVKGKKLVDGPE